MKQLKDMDATSLSSVVHAIDFSCSLIPPFSRHRTCCRRITRAQTWLQEANGNVELAASAAAAYGADVNDLALSDDGTCFFWRDSRVHLMRSSLSSVALQLPLPAFAIAVQRKAAVFCGWSKAGMKFVLSQPPRAFPAESNLSRDFVARHAFSHQLFHDYAAFCSGIMPPSHGIVLCDSNDSSEYAASFIAAGGSVDHTLPHRLFPPRTC